jgi:cytidylate kinase
MVIILNGSINSGKTTVAKILWNKIPNTAFIEVDKLREFIDWMPGKKAFPLSLQNAVLVMKSFIKKGLNVIIAYPLDKNDYKFIINKLKDINTRIYTFTLNPDIRKTLTDRGTRELTKREVKRIKYHYQIGINKPSFGKIINNTNQSPQETAGKILSCIEKLNCT